MRSEPRLLSASFVFDTSDIFVGIEVAGMRLQTLFGIELFMLRIRESPNGVGKNCTKMLPDAGSRVGKAVRDAVTRMHIRRNVIVRPAKEPKS